MAGLHFDITGDNKNLLRNLEGSKQGIRSLTREAEKESMNLDDIMKRIGQSAAAIGVGFSATQLIRDVARVRGEFQQLEVALNTMLGSEEKANELFQQLVNTAAKTPFDLKGVAGGAKQLLAYGVAAEEVNDTIIRLGDIAAGLSIPLGDLVYLYGTTMTQGRLFTQDLRQFMGRGIPLADELAKQFGVAKDEVGGLVTAGKVGFPEVEKAIRAMTSEGGKFAGLMENQSKTITGQISNLEDAVDSMFNEIGKSTQGAISGVLSTTTQMVENYEEVARKIGFLVTAYGSYKAVMMAIAAFTSVQYKLEQQALTSILAAKSAELDADLASAVAKGTLTKATALEVQASREEVKSKLQSAIATDRMAQAELQNATVKFQSHQVTLALSKQRVRQAQQELAMAKASGNAQQIQNAQLSLNNAIQERNIATRQSSILRRNMETAATAAETTAHNRNTLAQEAEGLSTKKLIAQKLALAKANLKATLTNPYVLAAAAVAALAVGIYALVTAKSAEEKAIDKLNKKREEAKKAREEERESIDNLLGVIRSDTQTRVAQEKAYDELSKKVPELVGNMSLEEFQAKNTAEAEKQLNEILEQRKYNTLSKELSTYKDMLKEVEAADGNWSNLSLETQNALRDMFGTGLLKNKEKELKVFIENTQKELDEYNQIVERVKPIDVKIADAQKKKEEIEAYFAVIKKMYEEAKAKIQGSNDEGLDIPLWLKDAYEEYLRQSEENEAVLLALQEQQKAERLAAQKKESEEQKKIREKINQQVLDMQRANEQARINLIKDADEKRLAQIKFDFEKEKEAINAQRLEWESLQGGKLTQEQEVTISTRYERAESTFKADTKAAIEEKLERYQEEKEQQRKQYEELLEEFETYEQARERIAKEYAEKRKQMVNEDGSLKAGFTQGNIDNLEAQQRADEDEIDQMFVEKNEVYKGWLEEIEKMTLDNLREALVNAQFALELAKARGDGEGIAVAEAQVEKLEEKIKDVSSETDPKKRSVEEWRALSEVVSEASGVFEELGDRIGDTAGDILKSVGSIGSSTVGLINNITQLTEMSMKGMDETAKTSSKSVQAVEKASVILAIISAAIQIITKIINLGKQLHNAKFEKAIEASQDKIDDLSKSYENLAEKVDEAFGNKRVQGLKEMNANLERQNALIRQQMEDEEQVKQKDSEYEAAMDDYNAKLEENQKKQEENKKAMEEAIFGEDIQSAIENFADAYAEALEGNMDMNATAKEQAVRMMKNMVMESIKEYVAGSKKMEQIRAKMDALYADGVFSAADQKLIIGELEQFNKELDDRFGWAEDLFNEEEASSSSSKKGIATASQESVDENNGRLMSIQLSMGEIKEQMIYTVTYLASMSSGVATGNNILSDIREQAVRTNGHLEDIVKYTKPLNDKISEVVSAINRINSK
jgi:tape measure domain-containing protein